jgi:hypothetical protein
MIGDIWLTSNSWGDQLGTAEMLTAESTLQQARASEHWQNQNVREETAIGFFIQSNRVVTDRAL